VGVYHVWRDGLVRWLEDPELILDPVRADVEQCPKMLVMQEAAAA